MALPTAVLSYGSTALQLGDAPRIVRRADGFDEGQFDFIGGTEDSLPSGALVPGYAGMYVSEDSITDYSGALEHDVRAIGLRTGTRRKINSTAVDSEDGFDSGSETWIAPVISPFAYGLSHQQYPGLYIVSASRRDSPVAAFAFFDLQFKGIKSSSRPVRFKFSTATREITLENFIVGFSGGDTRNPHKWNILKGETTMEKSYLSASPPDYTKVGVQLGSVPGFPATSNLNYTYSTDALTWQWPNGVVLAAINAEQVPNRNAWFITETYIKRDKITA